MKAVEEAKQKLEGMSIHELLSEKQLNSTNKLIRRDQDMVR